MHYSFCAKGHRNVTATHPTTIAFTKDAEITKKGDCFVGCCAQFELDDDIKKELRDSNRMITVVIRCNGKEDSVSGYGDEKINPTDKDLVIRKSSHVCPRTLLVRANKAAKGLDRGLVTEIQKGSKLSISLYTTSA